MMDNERNVMLEMLILEAKGFLNVGPRRIIEMCNGWCEGSCDGELEFRKYLEAYDSFLVLYEKYVLNNLHKFGLIEMFEEIDGLIDSGHVFKDAVVMMIRDKFSYVDIPLAEPPYEMLRDDYKECIRVNGSYMDTYMFKGKVRKGIISLEIEE